MRVVEDFIKMMEDDFEFCSSDKDKYSYGATVRQEIMESHEYIALKATIDKQEEVKDMKYTTVEGAEIKIGECYETRDGRKVFVSSLDGGVHAMMSGEEDSGLWKDGTVWGRDTCDESQEDLMRPWKEDKQKLVVTDSIVNLACDIYEETNIEYRYGGMKAVLQAVFNTINSDAVTQQDIDNKEDNAESNKPVTEEKPLDDGWILHINDTQPVGDNVEVYIHRKYEEKPDTDHSALAKDLWWGVTDNDSMIIAYRIISEPESAPTPKQTLLESSKIEFIFQSDEYITTDAYDRLKQQIDESPLKGKVLIVEGIKVMKV